MSDVAFLLTFALLGLLAVAIGAMLGKMLGRILTEGHTSGYPKCTHCGMRSLMNNSNLFMTNKGQPWTCLFCRRPNKQKLVPVKVRSK